MDIAIITGASSGLGHEYAKTLIDLYPDLDEIRPLRHYDLLGILFLPDPESGGIFCLQSVCPVPEQSTPGRKQKGRGKHSGIVSGHMDTEMNPRGGSSQSDLVDKLPFLDVAKITRKSVQLAARGRAIYTPGAFYQFYRLSSKLLPSAWMIKIAGKSYL